MPDIAIKEIGGESIAEFKLARKVEAVLGEKMPGLLVPQAPVIGPGIDRLYGGNVAHVESRLTV
jgi:hypothetical protein